MKARPTWTRRALWCVAPVHAVLGTGGLLMVYPWLFNYVVAAVVASVAELVAYLVERLSNARPDPDHRWLSWTMWVTAALSIPLKWEHLGISLACAAAWRLAPRITRPIFAVSLAVAMASFSTWLWKQSFGEPEAMEYLYVTLYAATTLPLAVLAVERTVGCLRERVGARSANS